MDVVFVRFCDSRWEEEDDEEEEEDEKASESVLVLC
jgi:hypothetical protein